MDENELPVLKKKVVIVSGKKIHYLECDVFMSTCTAGEGHHGWPDILDCTHGHAGTVMRY